MVSFLVVQVNSILQSMQTIELVGTLRNGSMMSQLWPTGDDVPQLRSLTNYSQLLVYNPFCGSIILSSGGRGQFCFDTRVSF